MNTFSHVPPGFRFHPTDEELVDYYLRKKIASKKIDLDVIKDVDLYRIEPWDLQELCRLGSEEQNEWYFFSHKDKKYPTGTRTNRATKAGFWKATGRDKAIYARHCLVGMRKTLVFYKGRAPNGQKSDWIMHEYRLETNENATPQEEGWVVCRVFKKRMTTVRKMSDYDQSPCWYEDHVTFMPPELHNTCQQQNYTSYHSHYPCKQELELQYTLHHRQDSFLQLPHLESPKVPQSAASASYGGLDAGNQSSTLTHDGQNLIVMNNNLESQAVDQVTDWRVLDKFVASQLSHADQASGEETNYVSTGSAYDHVTEAGHENNSNNNNNNNIVLIIARESGRQESTGEDHQYAAASTSASSCQIDLWK